MGGAWQHKDRLPLKADRHVFCRIDGKDYGIGLISDLLARFAFRATHFVEMMATDVNGEADTREVVDYLLGRDQDVQLHAHPTYNFFAEALRARAAGRAYQPPADNDFISSFSHAQQLELLERAVALFQRFTGRKPAAFRAGSYAANRATARCLAALGIVADTSYNPCYPALSFPGESLACNCLSNIEGVWEIPITVARTRLRENSIGLKPADPCAVSFVELKAMLEGGAKSGQSHFVIVFHSFSAVKPKDETYSRMKPDTIVIRRLERLVEYLASRPDLYNVSTFSEFARQLPDSTGAGPPLAELGVFAAGVRKSVQGLNRFYWL